MAQPWAVLALLPAGERTGAATWAGGASQVTSDVVTELREAFLAFVAGMVGINEIEAYRRYRTNVQFANGIDALVNVALSVISPDDGEIELLNVDLFKDNDEAPASTEPLWESFVQGLSGN